MENFEVFIRCFSAISRDFLRFWTRKIENRRNTWNDREWVRTSSMLGARETSTRTHASKWDWGRDSLCGHLPSTLRIVEPRKTGTVHDENSDIWRFNHFESFRSESSAIHHIRTFRACSTALRTILHSWIGEINFELIRIDFRFSFRFDRFFSNEKLVDSFVSQLSFDAIRSRSSRLIFVFFVCLFVLSIDFRFQLSIFFSNYSTATFRRSPKIFNRRSKRFVNEFLNVVFLSFVKNFSIRSNVEFNDPWRWFYVCCEWRWR